MNKERMDKAEKGKWIREKLQLVLAAWAVLFLGGLWLYLSTKPAAFSTAKDGYYEIYNSEDYEEFWNEVGKNKPFLNGRLMADIYLNDVADFDNWESRPPENESRNISCYYGDFDGNGHTIYGLYSENGYGLVKRNRGEIHDLAIKQSLIVGDSTVGGICFRNYSLISGCTFSGEVVSNRVRADEKCRMAGICVENKGKIERCGYEGTMVVRKSWLRRGERAGICAKNEGTVLSCYNLVQEVRTGSGACYAVADTGEENCYMLKASDWQISENSRVRALDEEQVKQLSAYLDRDIYSLCQGEISEPRDKFISEFVFDILMDGEGDFSGLELEEMQTKENGAVFALQASLDGKPIRLTSYELKEDINEREDDTLICEKLWESCKSILGEKDSQDWQHDTWLMLNDEEKDIREGVMLLYHTAAGKQGIFCIQNETLYRIEPDGTAEEAAYFELKDQIEELSVITEGFKEAAAGSYAEESARDAEEAEDQRSKKKNNWTLEGMVLKLWQGRVPNDGILWKDAEIRKAVYCNAMELSASDYDGRTPSREEVMEVESLNIWNLSEIATLEDLTGLENLKCLSVSSCNIENAESIGKLTQLTELYLPNCNVTDISFMEDLTELTHVSLYGNKITDISPLAYCRKLEELSLGYCGLTDISALAFAESLKDLGLQGNRISDIEPLRNLKNLTGLNLMSNQVEDISPLKELTGLTALGLADNRITDISPLEGMEKLYNLALDVNEISDISALKNMTEMEWLGLSHNQIRNYTPIMHMKKLFYLSVTDNPVQDIGELMLTPNLWIGITSYTEELEEAQKLLNNLCSEKGISAEDITRGDLNQDGIEDLAITGYFGQEEDENGNIIDWGIRKVYPFLGTEDGSFVSVDAVDTRGPGEGGIYGDPYQGIAIAGNCLVVQCYGGSNFRWAQTDIYQYENGALSKKYRHSLCNWTGNADGYDWYLYDEEKQTEQHYAVQGQRERSVQKLLIGDSGLKAESDLHQELNEKLLAIEEEKGVKLPAISEYFYEPDIDGGGYYYYEIHDPYYDTEKTPDDILEQAKKLYLQDAQALPVTNYTSEEIKENYDKLAGVVLPGVFYLGFDDETPQLLSYQGCKATEEEGYIHVLSVKEPNEDNDWWINKKIIYYYENRGIFE